MSEKMNGPVEDTYEHSLPTHLWSLVLAQISQIRLYEKIHTIVVDMVGGFPDVRQDHVVFSKLFPEGETSACSLLKGEIIQSKTDRLTLNMT